MKENIIFPFCLLLVTIGSLAYLGYNYFNSTKVLRALSNEYNYYRPIKKIDINDPATIKRIQDRVKHYESTERSLVLPMNQIEKNTRKLAESNAFEEANLVDPLKTGHGSLSQWVAKKIKLYSPSVIVYPYAFNHTDVSQGKNVSYQYKQGAFLSLGPKEEIAIRMSKTVNLKKARALYDQDIAILSIEVDSFDKGTKNLFTDSNGWCNYFEDTLKKGNECQKNLADYLKAKEKNPTTSYYTKITYTDIIAGILTEDGFPRFGILVFPDFELGGESIIISFLTDKGIKNIVDFYNAGGSIIVSGKSGYLLEAFGLLTPGSYDSTKVFKSDTINSQIKIKGCEKTVGKTYDIKVDDFDTQLLCVGITSETRPALFSTFKMNKVDTSFNALLSIDPNFGDLIYVEYTVDEEGLTKNLTDSDKAYTPLILNKENKKGGKIFILNFNPFYENGNKNIVFNLLALIWSKEMYLTSKVSMAGSNQEIPAGEADFELKVQTLFHNLNDKAIDNFKMYIFLPENFGWNEKGIPANCTKKKIGEDTIPSYIENRRIIKTTNEYLFCQEKALQPYEKRLFNLTIDILNYKATSNTNKVALEPIVSYVDSKGKINIFEDQVKISVKKAAVLRAFQTQDKNLVYPLQGKGYHLENTLKIENREDSRASNVEFYDLIPIVSPLIDSYDQRLIKSALNIYVDYYNNNKFEVPFNGTNAVDYIYPAQLEGKGVKLVKEWNTVLQTKEIYNGTGVGKEVTLDGISQGMIFITSTTEVIKQTNYRNAKIFYKKASHRLMAFVDPSTPEGMKTLYGSYDKVPKEWQDTVLKDRCKKEFIFTRSDIFFDENGIDCNPNGIKIEHLFSIDNYKNYSKFATGCMQGRVGAQSKKLVTGYFDNSDSEKKKTILKPNEWSNEMFEYCNLTIIDPTNENEIKKVFNNTNNFRPAHYTFPNIIPNITQPEQIYGFKQIDKYHGYMEKYPSVKFIYVHSLSYVIKADKCLSGGMIEINLGTYDIKSVNDVTLSPDKIAFYETTYEKHIIKAYFKRGLMSNEKFGKDIKITINIENLNSTKAEKFKITLWNSKYDIFYPPNYERYISYGTEELQFNYVSVFSYPALELKTQLNGELSKEVKKNFSKYKIYIQEIGHRTVFGTGEAHHQTNPGLTINSKGFSLITNLGMSSIPFIEYVTTGSGQIIPAGTSTSRVSWKDLWGRMWSQPLPTQFLEFPPSSGSGSLSNFMMSTTFEILYKKKQIYELPSNKESNVLLHIKLLNDYQKYFEITRCKENQILFVPETLGEVHSREFKNTSSANLLTSELNGDKMFLSKGGFASYGKCFLDDGAIIGGKKMDEKLKNEIGQATLCEDSNDDKVIKECQEKVSKIAGIHKKPDNFNSSETWNYSPLVDSYYPKGYIEEEMWQMSLSSYDDNALNKANKHHMDNLLPNLDNKIIKPHNSISIPIYKGLDYEISYDNYNTIKYHGADKTGWWSDNLQNKDDTLLAGQETCNKISVDKQPSIKDWVDYKSLVGSKRTGSNDKVKAMNEARIKNIYVCLYNRKRPIHPVENTRTYYAGNINQNNIVPIIVSLDKDDQRLTNYNCTQEQYTPDNIYTMTDNYLETPTDRDSLYFAANLRGQAKETLNILMRLQNIGYYEGMVKVNEGGRFVYNNVHSYFIVDNPVSIINGKRNDIGISNEIFPSRTTTFNAVVYHLYTFSDSRKINQKWPFSSYYTNSHGFGDFSISIYVGGENNTKPILQPGEFTYAKIVIFNNCGFDIKMLPNAIEGEKADSTLKVNSVQKPSKYNFFKYTVVSPYTEYVSIEPSDHKKDESPEFFDFQNINVLTIRDGYIGEYYLKVTLSKSFPDNLRGKPIEIKIDILPEYFEQFPGADNDPIKSYHSYKVSVPSAYIACPFKSGDFSGQVLYSSAIATTKEMLFTIGIDWKIDGIKYIDQSSIDKMRKAVSEENSKPKLLEIYNAIAGKELAFEERENQNEELKDVSITGVIKDYPSFPKVNIGAPDIAKVSFIVKSTISQLPYDENTVLTNVKMTYKDWIQKDKIASGQNKKLIADGAWLEITYFRTLVEEISPGVYVNRPEQKIPLDQDGVIKVQFRLENIGNAACYYPKFHIVIQPNLTYISDVAHQHTISSYKNEKNQTILTIDYVSSINSHESKGGYIYLGFEKYIDSYGGLTEEDLSKLPSEMKIIDGASTQIDLTNTTGEVQVTQYLRKKLNMDYDRKAKTSIFIHLLLTKRRRDPAGAVKPVIKYLNGDTENDVEVSLGKIDLTNYNQTNQKALRLLKTELEEPPKGPEPAFFYQKEKPKEIKDWPCQKSTSNHKHVVLYSVSLYNKRTKTTANNYLRYEQEKIGLSIYEYILIAISFIIFALDGLFIYLGYKNLKKAKNNNEMDKVENEQVDNLLA